MTHVWVMSINRHSLGKVTACYAEDVDDVEDAVCLFGICHNGKPQWKAQGEGATFSRLPNCHVDAMRFALFVNFTLTNVSLYLLLLREERERERENRFRGYSDTDTMSLRWWVVTDNYSPPTNHRGIFNHRLTG